MIQEKDFLCRVPVKTSPITTPGGQIRNPEILVDIEGGEFMHGNILDANSTNKLINQSVDDKITEGGYVTKNLLDAETARATAKENEIKAQVDIINGDSTTEGSFRKAIADVVAAAPEDLDTLKEIADKLAGNDDLHTALNQAITEKADASALLNEVARATGVENNLKATLVNYALNSDVEEKLAQKADTTMLSEFIDKTSTEEQAINSPLHAKEYISVFHNTADGASGIKITNSGILAIDQLNENASPNKVFATDGSIADLSQYADATTLSNYVLTTALNQQVDTLNTAISAKIEGKQDKGNYVTYSSKDDDGYYFDKFFTLNDGQLAVSDGEEYETKITGIGISIVSPHANNKSIEINGDGVRIEYGDYSMVYDGNGINSLDRPGCVPITDGTLKPLSDFALTTDLHNVIRANNVVDGFYELDNCLKIGSEAEGFLTMSNSTISSSVSGRGFVLNWHGLTFEGRRENNEVPTTDGSFISLNNYVLKSEYNKKITALEARIAALEAKHQEAA